ncbi:Major facilitator superfamily domain-containing protein 1 [Lamellibrachia satsuma]|nr:Major facilitator superfamily domain-containing protein 1 [Lamellibrachia satsuma]
MPETGESDPLIGGSGQDEKEAEELTGCGATLACDPRRPLHKYLVLIIMCFLSFGSYFCYDNPAALATQMETDLGITTGSYMLLYAWYSWPNVVLCWFGGILIDRVLGLRLGAMVFAGFVTAGQVVFALGAYLNKFWLMELGRFIFGVGGESLCVAQNTYAVGWFKDSTLNTVFGLQLSFSRVGSTVNMNVMRPLYKYLERYETGYKCLGLTLFVGAAFCVMSLLCTVAVAYFDKRADRILKKKQHVSAAEPMRLKDMVNFRLSVWLLCIICVAYYVTVFPFIGLGQLFFQSKFGVSAADASGADSLVYIISAVAAPVFGFLIDRTGRNIVWMSVGVFATLACHGTLCFTFINPYIPMSIMGLAYSVVASALWPMVAFVVPTNQTGTAYGIMQAVQNLGLAVISLVAGKIVDAHGYFILEVFFMIWLCLALGICAILWINDAASNGGVLNQSAGARARATIKLPDMIVDPS